jgi:DNA transformation protein
MAARSEFVDFLLEQLVLVGPVAARSMFGGHGIFLDGTMFGLVASDTLYLKVDDVNRGSFEDAGMGPFVYDGKKGPVAMSYYEAPPDAVEDPETLLPWAQSAVAAASRSKAKKPRRRR